MLNNLRAKFANWMRGRYGMDALYKFTMAGALVFLILNLLFPSPLMYFIFLAFILASLLRAFSKNHTKRTAENQKYLVYKNKFNQKFLQLKNRFRDRNTHRYRNCPNCKQTLRLPKKVGMNHVTCPKCKHEFTTNIRF